MARMLRLEYPGGLYHVTARGNERKDIFRSDGDRLRFLEKLAGCIQAHHVRVYAYVLMSNHFHLLVQTPRANLSAFMQQLNTSYSVYFNRRYGRTGHLLGGRYKAPVVEGDEYLLTLTRYVHLNPVQIRTVRSLPLEERMKRLAEYRWSSYPEYVGRRKRTEWMDYGPLSDLVGGGRRRRSRERAYRWFVEEGLVKTDEEFQVVLARSRKAIGTEAFCRWAEGEYRKQAEGGGKVVDAAMRRVEVPHETEEVLRVVTETLGVEMRGLKQRRRKDDARLLAMKVLKEWSGLTQREVANVLGLRDGSGVSRHLAEVNARLTKERTLQKAHEQILCALNH